MGHGPRRQQGRAVATTGWSVSVRSALHVLRQSTAGPEALCARIYRRIPVKELITFPLKNFSLTFLCLGFLVSAVSLLRRRGPVAKETVADKLLADYILYAVGFMYLYNFVVHTAFAQTSAAFIGWANSPFQYEVGYASLGFGVAAILAHRSNFMARLVAVVGPSLFLWGAAVGHVRDIVMTKNFSPGNAGVVLWTDLFLPMIGFALLYFYHRQRSSDGSSGAQKPSAVAGTNRIAER